ncbi:MAG: hypothetical protein ABR947_05380 [Solirubrobacteraceae bacterium]|jgi:hypothetical protein
MSWIPTLRIARAAWKGSKDPVGTIKAQLIDEQPQAAPSATAAQLPAVSAHPVPVPATPLIATPIAEPAAHELDPTHAHLLLLRP